VHTPNTTLVTGAAGFAGSHLIDALVRDRVDVVAWTRPNGHEAASTDGVRRETVDILDRSAVREAMARIRPAAVFHCAGAAHVGKAWDHTESTLATNVMGTHHVLDALRHANVESRVLIPSSALVYTPADRPLTENDPLAPSSPYGVSKLAQELLAHHAGSGVTVTIARAFNHVGPRQDPFFAASGWARRIADIERGTWAPEIAVGNLDARRDLTDVRDTVRAYRLILEHGRAGEAFNVCSGRAIEMADLLRRLIARARVPVTVKVDPSRYRPNDSPLIVGDYSRAKARLGWSPEVPLDKTLDDLLEYWRQCASC
jgi:GDP-4-dehydro-6-deoxy-D-mannose reductase